MATTRTGRSLRDMYAHESSQIRGAFKKDLDGGAAVRRRAALVDTVIGALWEKHVYPNASGPRGFCIAARGGYGHGTLFPHSDIDLLFLFVAERTMRQFEREVSRIGQELWDLQLRAAPTARTLADCARFDRHNLELVPSLLDARYLVGDPDTFSHLEVEVIPKLVRTEWQGIVDQLVELTEARHKKYGHTNFHLEPNVKESPGGLRDYDVGRWLSLIETVRDAKVAGLKDGHPSTSECSQAIEFLYSVRWFLHVHHGRGDNTLTWDAQERAAAIGVGRARGSAEPDEPRKNADDAAHWMRSYFRYTRQISRWMNQLLDDASASRSSLYENFVRWRSRVGNADFSVVKGRVFFRETSSVNNPEILLGLFVFVARHGFRLAADTERRVSAALPNLAERVPAGPLLWPSLRDIVTAPHAGQGLRDMHALGVLNSVLPEFAAVDSLVIRDLYHHYTVDEHTFTAVEVLQNLRSADAEWQARFARILNSLAEPELLFLAVLLHDIGKASADASHLSGGVQVAKAVTSRFGLSEAQRESVVFLVANHLEMSAALRRDIFDRKTIQTLAEKVGSPELLKMLCLMTYADISAVYPGALTPWKADNLWHLYVGTEYYLSHNADVISQSVIPGDNNALNSVLGGGPAAERFLAGLPYRYVRTHSLEQIAAHFAMAALLDDSGVQVALAPKRDVYELTVVAFDRPALFANITGALTAWGMDILKADAYSNAAGVVVDTFVFRDRFNNLQLNESERVRFQQVVQGVVAGKLDVNAQIAGRIESGKVMPVKRAIATRISFDHDSSSHSTLLEVIAQDRIGLLYRIASTFAALDCNIDIALVDTEGPMAVDVFYITEGGKKLSSTECQKVQAALEAEL